MLQPVYIVGMGQIPVTKRHEATLRQLGAQVVGTALQDAGLDRVGALYLGNMLSDELQAQKHVAALVADEAGLAGIEALQVRAATATGAAALRMAALAVASGSVSSAVAVGVEKMSDHSATPALAKALDAQYEVRDGATMVSLNAQMMWHYREQYRPPFDAFANFSVNAHRNAQSNPNALFRKKQVTVEEVMTSRVIVPPLRLYDCAPICDGAAAIVLVNEKMATRWDRPVRILASTSATDRFRVADRRNPLSLHASTLSANTAFHQAGLTREDVDFFEVHDAFSIMACLQLEAVGFAARGEGWKLAVDNEIGLNGKIPLTTMGGLKARGHPIGASAIYQTIEISQQLLGTAGANQLTRARIGMLQSVGGAGTTILTHLFGRD